MLTLERGPVVGAAWLGLWFAVIAFHEFGHVVAAWATRVPVSQVVVTVGSGIGVHLFDGRVRFGILPGGGSAQLDTSTLRRSQHVAFALGGIVGNLVLTAVLVAIAASMSDTPVWLGVTAFTSLAMAISNLVPFASRRVGVRGTDGYQTIQAAFRNRRRDSA